MMWPARDDAMFAVGEPDFRGLVHEVIDALAEDAKNPAFRVKFIVSVVTAGLCGRAGMRLLPSMLLSLAAGSAAVWLYSSVEDIREKLTADYVDIPLGKVRVHDVPDCRGHIEGSADALAKDCCHAPGEV